MSATGQQMLDVYETASTGKETSTALRQLVEDLSKEPHGNYVAVNEQQFVER